MRGVQACMGTCPRPPVPGCADLERRSHQHHDAAAARQGLRAVAAQGTRMTAAATCRAGANAARPGAPGARAGGGAHARRAAHVGVLQLGAGGTTAGGVDGATRCMPHPALARCSSCSASCSTALHQVVARRHLLPAVQEAGRERERHRGCINNGTSGARTVDGAFAASVVCKGRG